MQQVLKYQMAKWHSRAIDYTRKSCSRVMWQVAVARPASRAWANNPSHARSRITGDNKGRKFNAPQVVARSFRVKSDPHMPIDN